MPSADDKPKAKMGRPRWEPTAAQLAQIEALAGYGLPQDQIAALMAVSEATLKRTCKQQLKDGIAKANSTTAQTLFQMANGRKAEYDAQGRLARAELVPSERVAIWLGKARLGMKETQVHEVGGRSKGENGRRPAGPVEFRLLPAESGIRVERKARGGSKPPE